MFNLYEIIANAQGGAAMANLARLYGLSQEQAQAAVEALLPAFALGLKRTTESPDGLSAFFGMLARNPYAEWFENAGRLFADASQQAMGLRPQERALPGEEMMALLFGSKEVSRAVAAQAAALSGVGIEITKAMMPVIAAMIAAGLPHAMRGQAGMAEAFQRAFVPMMPQAQAPEPAPGSPADFAKVWTTMMQTMLGQSEPPRPKAQPPAGPDIAAMTEQIQDLGRTGNATFSKMFEAGVDAQKAHMERLSQIFDAFVDTSKARGS
ncbi:DUF937 domain-containing protein [Blastochloris sulfoviridis]|uniref:DUF937 domain-containing protein n=1 Tax=Blastochloris sulfoviridis TaxID=50712 RepID=A0A5M6I3R3_9HYPH|nr:DUF937 domain-containing protein [Blastochloris sulfoviridis]KAA5602497.1 DUF937 domain-containing protein [Blastochloris sulfoviridis]